MTTSEQTVPTGVTAVVPVRTASRAYDVYVGCGILEQAGALVRSSAGGEFAAIVCDTNVRPLYASRVEQSLVAAGYQVSVIAFAAGEQHKRLGTLETILEELASCELSRTDVVVALGGGVTGDMAGLAAALYLRGVQVVQIPTSLLAMVDSSVGGKTAVDLGAGKNLAGAFHQPSLVLADVTCLHTLSHELLTDSCGEVIKHGVLADPALFDELCNEPITATGYGDEAMARVVARNIEIKRDVVNADEREGGIRQTLNLGHTLGHAIEAANDYRLGHGSSVAAGLCCVARAAEALGWAEAGVAHRIESACLAHGLPIDTHLPHQTIRRYAIHDKKRHGNTVNLIVPVRIGAVEIRKIPLKTMDEVIRLGCGTAGA